MSATPSHAEITRLLFLRLSGNAPLMAKLGNRIYNHVPQDDPLPAMRFRWEQAGEWDTKDSAGHDGFCVIDIWTDHRGDKQSQEIADDVETLLHLEPFTGMVSGQSLLLRHDFSDSFVEPDGLTHHTMLRFRHIATT